MKIQIFSVDTNYGNGKLRNHYIEKLKKYKIKETKYEEYGSIRYRYYIELSDLEDIFNLSKELEHELIIDIDNGYSITIYDDYVE